jgi:hypothetical protein
MLLPTIDLTAIVTPPPELVTSFTLEDFVSVQRLRPLTFLLRVRLLDLVFALISVISSEIYNLE